MNHSITIGGLLLGIGVVIGLGTLAFGFLRFIAGGMSDAPQLGDDEGKKGCATAIVGLVIVVGCLIGLFA